MIDYDFSTLNDKEFEVLVADIISVKDDCHVERFKPGKDGGKDGRFFSYDGGETVIQCKHWLKSGIKQLVNYLKTKELEKIKKISPSRYILATSLDLSDNDKKIILSELSPFIKSPSDILSKTDLNDFLSKNRNIEEKHYKLWLTSTNVLKNIFNAAIRGRSQDLLDDIRIFSKKYVITENHEKALKKLEKMHSVIITGEGGIGKTSLAGQLAYYYTAKGFEFCCIENLVNEAEKEFEKDKKQIFYFDDFLGRNYLTALEKHEDSHVINFIKRVSKDKKKRFILTSRSTVLNQGKNLSELFKINNVDKNEYQIEINSLSDLDKAEILYNHIWFGDIEEKYIDEIYKDKRYLKIIRHKNYNPRIISFITDSHKISAVLPAKYWEYIQSRLDNPEDVWDDVYNNQIGDLSRLSVLLVAFNGALINERDLKEAFASFAIYENLLTDLKTETAFLKTMKESVGAILNRFIRDDDSVFYNLFNPAVADFTLKLFSTNKEVLGNIFLFLNTTKSLDNLAALERNKKINTQVYAFVIDKIATDKLSLNHKSDITYKIKLSSLVINNVGSKNSFHNDLTALALNINNYPVINSIIGYSCSVLEWALNTKKVDGIEKIINEYVTDCMEGNIGHEDYISLCDLVSEINEEYEFRNTLLEAIKEKFLLFWQELVNEIVDESGALNDFCYPEEEDNVRNKLYDFLGDKFSELVGIEFYDEDYESVAEFVDISEKISQNYESLVESSGDYYNPNQYSSRQGSYSGGFSNNSSSPPPSEESQIVDLFDRS